MIDQSIPTMYQTQMSDRVVWRDRHRGKRDRVVSMWVWIPNWHYQHLPLKKELISQKWRKPEETKPINGCKLYRPRSYLNLRGKWKKQERLLITISSLTKVELPSTSSALGNPSVQNKKFEDKQQSTID